MWTAQGNNWVQTYPGTGTVLYTQSAILTIPSGVSYIDVMLIGGGGGGGTGGGAGGQVNVTNNVQVTPGTTYSITVGARGTTSGSLYAGTNGGDSVISGPAITATAYGGGGGTGLISTSVPTPKPGNTGGGSGTVSPNSATSGYTGGIGINGVVYGNFQAHAGGGGAGAGAGATQWYQVGCPSWGWFMNSYAIWTGGLQDVATRTYTTNVYFPSAGYYQFEMGVDNAGYLQLDGSTIISLEAGDTSWTFQANPASASKTYVTAGVHQISMTVTNFGGPVGGAVRVLDSANNIFWTTRSYTSINAQAAYLPGTGGIGLSVIFDGVQYDVGGGGAGGASGYLYPNGSVQTYTATGSFGGGNSSSDATSWGGGGGGIGGNGYQGLVAIKYHQ
jgi:hypothetical protein